jgi:hypothetical protein
MTESNNVSDSEREADRRKRHEEIDRLWREFEESRERTKRAIIKLEVLRELSER